MFHFTMTMPLYLMMISGSILLLTALILRFLLKNRLPGYFFPILWGMVLIRFLVPFSLSSPLSLKLSSLPVPFQTGYMEVTASEDRLSLMTSVAEEEGTSVSDAMAVPGVPAVSVVEDTTGLSITAPSLYGSVFSRSLISAVYLLGIAVTAGILLLQKYRCHRKLKNSLLIEHNETVNAILCEIKMAHVLVYSNDEIASPLVCGLLMPHIYLPTRIDFQNQELLRHILAHETMHIKRRDNWMKTVMLAVLCLNWFNPLVWVMVGCLASDLETACDEAVLRACRDEEDRKSYAFSLLAMAVTPRRSLLLYSAFSKTEVEKRIQRILRYQKPSALMLFTVFLLLANSTVAFATGIQAPFDSSLSSTCYYGSDASRWAFKVFLTRDIALGENPGQRADNTILSVLKADTSGDPELIGEQMKEALSEEFHVEKNAFDPVCTLCIDDETKTQEYAAWELTRDENGVFCYQGETVQSFTDEMARTYQSGMGGTFDIVVQRNRFGYITAVTASQDGIIMRLTSAPVKEEP